MESIFLIVIFLYSVIFHEIAHGKMAEYLGDNTARNAGRLTLNPIPHLDAIGSIFLPFLLIITQSPIVFGWAKPVPYNPYNLGNQKYGNALVAGAGIGTNLILALIFGMLIRFAPLPIEILQIFGQIVLINLVLGIFNLVPIPPLDGSKIFFDLFPNNPLREVLERYGLVILMAFILFGFQSIIPLINILFKIFTGL